MKLNYLQEEERRIRLAESEHGFKLMRDPKGFPMHAKGSEPSGRVLPKPAATARELGQSIPEGMIEVACQLCGGSGFDPGGLDPFGELCPSCKGSRKEVIRRDYLAEALRIVQDPEANINVDREHLVAITQHARKFVSAAMSFPEVA